MEKYIVKRAVYSSGMFLWNEKIDVNSYFKYFKILHCDIKTAMLYELSKHYTYPITEYKIDKLWARPINNCSYCGAIYHDYISHT